jgi:periplasmic divalent cation tolerance protein
MSFMLVLVTTKNEDEAVLIARSLVEKKFVACCNIIKNVRSIYRWQGKLADDAEALMIIKTRQPLFQSLSEEVKRLHSYETPEIIALPIVEGSPSYLDWILKETS